MPNRALKDPDALAEYRVAITFSAHLTRVLADQLPEDVSLNQVRVLAEVLESASRKEVLEMRDLVARLGLGKSSVSRYVASLTNRGYGGKSGLDLLVQVEDPNDGRVRRVVLSPNGVALGAVVGEAMREALLVHKQRVIDYIQERSNYISVLAGLDQDAKVAVYEIRCPFSMGLYRSIVLKMISNPNYQVFFSELVDLTNTPEIEIDDRSIAAAIDTVKSTPESMRRKMVFLVGEGAKYSPIANMQTAFEIEGLPLLTAASSWDEAREHLGVSKEWAVSGMEPLVIQ